MLITIISIVAVAVIGLVALFVSLSKSSGSGGKSNPQEQQDTEFIQRLSYLLKIVIEHSSSERRQSSTREVIRIGEKINEVGGFRYMVKIHEAVTRQTNPKTGVRLKSLWKGIGEWRG